MADNTIALRVQQLGAEGVRARLREINQELKAGAPVTKELRGEVRELGVQVNTQSRVVRLNEAAWKDSHRTLTTAGRVMSTVGSIARSTLAATTAWSVASMAFGRTSSSLMEAEAGLARAQRELNAAMEGGDPEKIADAQENINILTSRIKELKDQDTQALATNILNVGATLAIMGSSAIQASGKIGLLVARVPSMIPTLAGLGAAAWVAAVPLALIAAIVLGIVAALYMVATPGDQVAEFFKSFFPDASKQIEQFSKDVDDVFTMHIPNAFIFMANSALTVFDAVIMGAENMVNGVIAGINAIISAVNSVAKFLRLPTIAAIPIVSFAGVTGNRIENLQSRQWGSGGPGTFSSGSQPAFASSAARGNSGAGGNVIINNTFNGDVTGEEVVNKVKESLKQGLQDRGFTGH